MLHAACVGWDAVASEARDARQNAGQDEGLFPPRDVRSLQAMPMRCRNIHRT